MLYCKKCGLKLDGKSVLCPRCGEYTYNSINDNDDNNNSSSSSKAKNTIYSNSNTNTNPNTNTNTRSSTSPRNAKTNDDIRYDIFNPPKKNYEDYSVQRQQSEDYNRQNQQNEDYKKPRRDRNPKEESSSSWAKTFFKWFFIILLLISVTAFAAYFAYNKFMGSSTSEYIKSISSLNKSINDANDNMVSAIKSNSNDLPVQDILNKIPEEKKSFDSIIKNFDDITVPSMYSSSHSNLGKAITLNREIYVQIDKVLVSPIDPNAKQNLDHLSSQIDECMSDYASVSIEDIAFSLPNEILSISSKIEPWINQQQEKYGSTMDQIKLFSSYFDSMTKLFGRFNEAKVDFTQAIKNVRAKQTSWDDLFSQIDENLNAKKAIKSDYKNLSVPSPVKSLNQMFMDILDNSISYNTKLKSAAEKESSFNKEGLTEDEIKVKQKEIEDAYKEAQELNSSSSAAYQKYASIIGLEKEKYANPEFVMGLGQGK